MYELLRKSFREQNLFREFLYILWFSFILGLNLAFFCFKLIIIHYLPRKQNTKEKNISTKGKRGHFRVPSGLCIKTRLGAQPFLWKWVLFAWEWKIIFISKVEHLTSFWYRGPRELGNGLLNHNIYASLPPPPPPRAVTHGLCGQQVKLNSCRYKRIFGDHATVR